MRLRVRYHATSELVTDFDQQLSRGGLLVRASPPTPLSQFAPITLAIASSSGEVTLEAQVLQVFDGVGVAVSFSPSAELAAFVEGERRAPVEGPAAVHEVASDEDPKGEDKNGRATSQSAEKVAMALRGTRDDRASIMREQNPTLHGFVLRNPGLQLDEVAAIAKLRTVTPELLKQIADHREWAQRSEVAIALVRNPKTPVGVAIRLLDYVSSADVKLLAKDQHTRAAVQQAARKKVIG